MVVDIFDDVDNVIDEKSVRDYYNFDDSFYSIATGLHIAVDVFVVLLFVLFDAHVFHHLSFDYNLKG